MKILRNVILMVFPLLIMINLYRYFFYNTDYTFRGFSYLHQYFSTFPGLNGTFLVIETLQNTATTFENIRVESLLDVFDAISKFFSMVGLAFSIPIMIVVDVARDIFWFISMFAFN